MGMISIINTILYKEQLAPEVGKEYHVFDDGKIRPNRHSIITITKVIPFNECNDNKLMSDWAQVVTDCYWLYANETDYFVEARYEDEPEDEEPTYFVRTKDGGWFSLGFWGSRLDIDGSLYKKMTELYGVEEIG
jgi:hypothetical protein